MLATLLTVWYARLQSFFSGVSQCTAADVLMRDAESGEVCVRADTLLIDVRPERERLVATVRGALSSVDEIPATNEHRVCALFCTAGVRSLHAARALRAARPELRVVNVVDGILGVCAAYPNGDAPLVDAHGRQTRTVHCYSATWNSLRAPYVGVYD